MTVSDFGQQELIPQEKLRVTPTTVALDDIEADYFLMSQKPEGALLESLKELGMLQPVLLAPAGSGGKYAVRDGRRRVRAARELQWDSVPAMIVEGDSTGSIAHRLVVGANALRSENPLSDYEHLSAMFKRGLNETDIAMKTGLAVPTIRKRMELANLREELLLATRDGQMAIGVAERAAKLTKAQQAALVQVLEERERITGQDVTEVRQVASKAAAQQVVADIPLASFTLDVDDVGAIDDDLAPATYPAGGATLGDAPAALVFDASDIDPGMMLHPAPGPTLSVSAEPLRVGVPVRTDYTASQLYHTTLANLFQLRATIQANTQADDPEWRQPLALVQEAIADLVANPGMARSNGEES